MVVRPALAVADKTVGSPEPIRIAMADDDTAEHLLMAIAAEEAEINAEFSFFVTGDELLEALHDAAHPHQLPQIIILDLRMPGLGGYEILDRLQKDPALWPIPVVVFTSSTRPVDRTLGLEHGARLFQNKPDDFAKRVSLARALSILAIDWTGVAPPVGNE